MWEIDIDDAVGKVMFCRKQTFATLDTTVRKVVIKTCPSCGYRRIYQKLPTQLVDSFKSTLDEVREADLLYVS
jgi:GTP-binding protein HflX